MEQILKYFADSEWGEPCRDMFDDLAKNDPEMLLLILESGSLRPGLLSFAAEIVGQISDPARAVPILLELLKYPSDVVREGAVYGLEGLRADPEVKEALQELLGDPSERVREAVSEIFEGHSPPAITK